MDKLLLKKAAVQSLALMIAVVTSSVALQQDEAISISAKDNINKSNITSYEQAGLVPLTDITIPIPDQQQAEAKVYPLATNLDELDAQIDQSIKEKLSDNYLVIRKPEEDSLSMTLEDLYVSHSIRLDMTGLQTNDITSNMILRVRGSEFYAGDPKYQEIVTVETNEDGSEKEVIKKDYGTDICHNVAMTMEQDDETGYYHVQLLLELDSVYAYTVYEDTNYFYIDLRKPSDVYDKILVIDAGHGGKDAGALSGDQQIYEKNINLGIVLQLKKLLDQENIKVYYTRTEDNTVFLRPRSTLANSVDSDYFISIHCNTSEASYPNGTEVLYYDNNFKSVSAKRLAELFTEEIANHSELNSRGLVLKQTGDIFIMDQAKVPTILIEVGYLSNVSDLNYLNNPEKQKDIAKGIYNGIMRAYNELPAE